MLFFDGAILQRSVHVFTLVAATRLKAERCTAHGWTLQQALSILRNAPAPLCPGYRVIWKLPLLFEFPSYVTWARLRRCCVVGVSWSDSTWYSAMCPHPVFFGTWTCGPMEFGEQVWRISVSTEGWECHHQWCERRKVKWNEVKWSAVKGSGGWGGRVFMKKVYRSSKWWEVKDWGESARELMIVKKKEKKLQEAVHSTVLLGCFYLLYML